MSQAAALEGPSRAINVNLARIHEVLDQTPTAKRFKTLSLAFSNLSHLLAYLDGNAGFISTTALTTQVRKALQSDALQQRCAVWLGAAPSYAVDDVIASRWLGWIERQQDASSRAARGKIEAALSDLDEAIRACDTDLITLLHRLGAKTGDYSAGTAFAVLTSNMADPDTRLRLSQVWNLIKTQAATGLEASIDAVIASRFEAGTLLAPTLAGGSLGPDALAGFIKASLRSAGAMSQALLDQVAPGGEGELALACEFPRYLSQHYGASARLKLRLEPALDMLEEIGERALGLSFQRTPGTVSPILVNDGVRLMGAIELDGKGGPLLVSSDIAKSGASARIFCRLNGSQPPTLSFDALRMVFHEFGHALAHLLGHSHRPSLPGLYQAPIERLELLSTWFEHWIYHRDLAIRLDLGEESRGALASAGVAKLLEVQRSMAGRAVCARLDLDLHLSPDLGAHAAWQTAVADLPGPAPAPSDVWGDFAHPLMRDHPGSAFVFPLAQAFAMDHLTGLIDQPISALSPDQARLGAAISPDVALELPGEGAVETFLAAVFARWRGKGGQA